MKRYNIELLMLVIIIVYSKQLQSQNLLSESFCHFVRSSAPKNESVLVVHKLDDIQACDEHKGFIKFISEHDLIKNLSKNPQYLIQYRIDKIYDNRITFLYTLFRVHRKGKKIMKGIIGSVDLTYCFDCGSNTFILCDEKTNFH